MDRRYRWPLGIGLAALAAVGAGVFVGQQASMDIVPFYANLSSGRAPPVTKDAIADDTYGASGNSGIEPVDLSYGRAIDSTGDDTSNAER